MASRRAEQNTSGPEVESKRSRRHEARIEPDTDHWHEGILVGRKLRRRAGGGRYGEECAGSIARARSTGVRTPQPHAWRESAKSP